MDVGRHMNSMENWSPQNLWKIYFCGIWSSRSRWLHSRWKSVSRSKNSFQMCICDTVKKTSAVRTEPALQKWKHLSFENFLPSPMMGEAKKKHQFAAGRGLLYLCILYTYAALQLAAYFLGICYFWVFVQLLLSKSRLNQKVKGWTDLFFKIWSQPF